MNIIPHSINKTIPNISILQTLLKKPIHTVSFTLLVTINQIQITTFPTNMPVIMEKLVNLLSQIFRNSPNTEVDFDVSI